MNPIEKPKTLMDYCYLQGLNQPSKYRSPIDDYVTRPHMPNMYPTFIGMEDEYTDPRESVDGRLSGLASRINALEPNRYFQCNWVPTPMCIGCDAPDHRVEECPFLERPIQTEYMYGGATNSGYMNEPYMPTYNPGWENPYNATEPRDEILGTQTFDQALSNQFDKDNEERMNSLENTLNNFMQITGQMLIADTQALDRIEIQIGQLIKTINEQTESELSSQSEDETIVDNGPELNQLIQFDQPNPTKFEELEEIPETKVESIHEEILTCDEVSTIKDHSAQPGPEPINESLLTPIEPMPNTEEIINGYPKIFPAHIEYIDLDPVEPCKILRLYLDLIIGKQLLTIKGIRTEMVLGRKYPETQPESRRELQTYVKIRKGVG